MTHSYSIEEGLLKPARQCPSANQDDRPEGVGPELIIIHNISLPPGEFGHPYIDDLFTNSLDPEIHPYFAEIVDQQVSAHLLIHRDGGVVQYVPFTRRAWHAGKSHHRGRECCNDFSIGIELEGSDEIPYTAQQYTTLIHIIISLIEAYPAIGINNIVGHSDVAPGRKTDPGPAFNWKHLRSELGKQLPHRTCT